MKDKIDRINRSTMASSATQYAEIEGLTPPETAALQHITINENDPILDLGVGGGRTVRPLLDISKDYLGVDYVEEMVEVCRQKYPGCRFEQGDARKLEQFDDDSFQMVFFSMNGISMVDHYGRLQILSEVHRILKPGGYFLFSTYNIDSEDHRKLLHLPRFQFSTNPIRTLVRCARFTRNLLISINNRVRYRRHEIHTAEYSIINDRCHNYSTMLYYISLEEQKKQLVETGFDEETILAFDLSGSRIDEPINHDSIFYLVTKS